MDAQRKSLPVYSFRDQLLSTIRGNAVTVVEGETGSGKTTQVPQYVLEDAAERGETGNIIVAQVRRGRDLRQSCEQDIHGAFNASLYNI
jgi:HrpA-like RNA helicase